MSLATETKELSDKYQALVSKSFKDNAELFKRFTALYTDGAKEFSSGPPAKTGRMRHPCANSATQS